MEFRLVCGHTVTISIWDNFFRFISYPCMKCYYTRLDN